MVSNLSLISACNVLLGLMLILTLTLFSGLYDSTVEAKSLGSLSALELLTQLQALQKFPI
jgi:hypothetical protein